MKKMEADVIVVAAGPAGLAAAITAGENDLKAIVFEKSNTTGGAANMGMGPLGIGTKIQKKEFKDLTLEEAYDIHMKYTHYRVDGDLVQTYFEKSADTIEWLQDMGVEFAGAFKYFTESAATWHIVKPENGVIGPRAAGPMVRIMTEKAKELGAEIYLETPVKGLIMEDGKCVGVKATDKDGEEIEARAKAVVVATGGFGTNPEMIKEEFGLDLWKNFFPFNVPGTSGDGLKMMWEAGAMKWRPNIEMIYQLKDNMSHFVLDACMRQPALLVNQNGKRFLDEGQMGNTTFTGNAINLQPGKCAYCILDRNLIKYYAKNGPDIFDIVHPEECFFEFENAAKEAIETGYDGYFEADTIEELAEKMGIDPDTLAETLEDYNDMCDENMDTQFHKSPRFLHPITGRKGGFIAARFYIAAYGTIGGVRTNKYGEVLNEDLEPIPGLYSAGSDCNTIYGDSYNFTLPGNTMGFAINSGRMAGEAIADYIDELDD
ncbi:MAG TPA: FAD-dependent oxidoreductase [Candidatus Eubacterium avistercoris]|uniref:FAD-dependent oxidoreductase n=1 Tax=Candidatus Eubacterium avistercoris TaxID=2838567 RepID=A0A9D2D106_9FIRM|nr:FAD-dependent oxidoreductase [Candidatus Eubacterium avistercoris]